MYRMMLFGHSYLRWIVILLALYVCVRSFLAWRRGAGWGRTCEKLSVALVGLVDLQFLIGLVLYFFLSPLSKAFLAGGGGAMKDPLSASWDGAPARPLIAVPSHPSAARRPEGEAAPASWPGASSSPRRSWSRRRHPWPGEVRGGPCAGWTLLRRGGGAVGGGRTYACSIQSGLKLRNREREGAGVAVDGGPLQRAQSSR
jgi:hypothetical protein